MGDGKFNVLFRREMMYANNKDAEIEKVDVLIKRANRKLIPLGKQLYVSKTHSNDKDAENRICITGNK